MEKPATKPIESGHTPDELSRWKHARTLAMQAVERARAMLEWADKEIARIEKNGA